ncbi:uncharacterized protein [Diabrotica undecimpunctata]|uniref:uncharacterized protein n=1 Tax=Diabrotica undecimpunctata TaxID=50387 RepID=UPI003B63AB15
MTKEKKNSFQKAIENDPVLTQVKKFCLSNWPKNPHKLEPDVKYYYNLKEHIHLSDNLLFFDKKIIIPAQLRKEMLCLIHAAHFGIQKSKLRAREIMYWPKMSKDIEFYIENCEPCQLNKPLNQKETLINHKQPERPWQFLFSDFLEFKSKSYLLIVDLYSHWIELFPVNDKTANTVIRCCKETFSKFGIPDIFFADNVPFNSFCMKQFAREWNFELEFSSPDHHQSNGFAEKYVQICKNMLKKISNVNELQNCLMEYRNTPLTGIGFAPSQLLLNRIVKTKLPISSENLKSNIVDPQVVSEKLKANSQKMKDHYDKTAKNLPTLQKGDNVLFRKNNSWQKESIDAVDLHTENREEIEDKYFSAMSRIDGKLSQLTLSNSSSSPSHSQSQEPASNSNVRLPPISVPNFNGEYSEPLTLIDSLEVTHENFDLAITILEKKYDNNLAIINSHINAIIDFPTLSKSNYHSLNEFVNDLKRHIDSLKILHVPIESWDYLLINIIIRKLDFATKRYYGERRDRDNTPSIVELFEILNERCNILADLTYTSDSKREKSHGKYNATSLHLNASATLPSRVYIKCNYCNDSAHKIYTCRKFSSLPHSEKYNFLKANHMCSNCLGTKHTHADCPSRTCSICSKKHHTLLHQNSYAQNTNYSGSSHSPHSENYRSNINGNHSRFNHSTQNPSYDNRTKHNSFRQPNDASPTTSQNTNSPSLSYQHKNTTHSTEPLRTNNVQPSTSNNFPDNGNDSSVALSATNKSFTYSSVLLSTVQVNLIDKSGRPLLIKAVLDSGSQKTFCSQELLSKIICKIYHRELQISGISQGSFTSNLMANINVHSPNLKSQHLNLNCAVIPKITCQLPQFHIQPNKLNIPKGFTLADKHFYQKSNIDLLIGADYYYDILQPGLVKLGHNLPTLFNTIFGWVIAGNIPNYAQSKNDVSLFVQTQNTHSSDSNLEALVSKFWETEDCPGEKILSPDDQLAESNFINHLKILENGRFQVNLPQKSPSEHLKLGESFQIAKKRFESLEKRFKNDSNLYNAYKHFIDQYISLNHGKYVPLTYHNSLDENKYFLPHHCVLKDSATTKLRVVFDGSAKTTSGYSLNQILLTGFQTQPDLFDILCRFRQFKFVFIADIEKMYRQINVNPNQTFLQNILWRDSPHEPLKCIELTSVTYGVTCSSFLATRCLKEIATLNTTKYPLGSDALLNQTYVDDILYGTNTLAELEAAEHELNSILNGHSITLHKWVSNSAEFSAKYIRSSQSNYEITSNNLNTNKVLGLSWHPLDDYFTISIPSPPAADNSFTKRNALSALAKIFDPIGLLGSFTVTGKVFIQKLWLNKLNWDDPLPETLAKEWKRFINDLTLLESLKVPRNLFNSRQISKIEIHGFADASSKAQAAVLYFHTIYADDTISCTLIASKSRLAPLKTVSIPRLELSAMLLLSRFRAKPMEQIMGNLPKVRITPSRPFQNVGCDFGGPFLIKSSKLRKAPMQKCYISIFVCLATKAVHIELVSSLSTDSFLLCLKRFIARRGLPSLIYSDNATNFAGSKNELKDLREFFKSPSFSNDMQNFAAQNFIEWKFIPPHSPHWGGIWEAAIKSAKYHIRRMIGNAYLVFEEFSTILSQIEAILNSRPICPLSNDPSDLQCLTPGHFLIGSSLTSYPEKTLLHLPINRLNFLQRCSQIQQSFWKRWSVEYLSQLHSRPKWSKVSQNIKINDLVLLRTDNCPPLKWPTARVLELFPGLDNHVRAVKIRPATGETVRPITKLYLLPQFD